MKILAIVFSLLFSLGSLEAQFTLKGKVTDPNGEPLAGVSISERNTSNGTYSAEDGSFTIDLSSIDAVIVFRYTGYATQEVISDGRSEINIAMFTVENLLDHIVVVGTRRTNRTQTETPVPVDIINIGQLSQSTARADVTSLLNYSAPSLNYNKQSGSDGADHIDLATLRGLGPDQTLVLVNGKRRHQTAFIAVFGTRGRGNSGTDLSAIPVQAIDRIEILRDGASAQYGSDAIAGVVNILLKKNVRQVSADVGFSGCYDKKYNPAFNDEVIEYGIYETGDSKKMDGLLYTAAVNYGLPLGSRGGFLNMTLNYANQGKTYRQELDGELPFNIYRRAHGDASLSGYGAMFNSEVPVRDNDRLTFYAFGGYNSKESDAFAFTRNFSARPERFPTDGPDLIEVPGIIRIGSDEDPYFNPHIQTAVKDVSFAAGLRGVFGNDWNWDASNNTGQNDFHFFGDKTFNAGLGPNQTHFDDGGFKFLQNTTNVNFSRLYLNVMSGLNVAFGAEFRYENYQLYAGEEASYANYDSLKASGSQGFPGYQPDDEVNANRSCLGAYGDIELDLTDRFLAGLAVRLENYSDFGFTPNFKVATRYRAAENFNLRASASTGFRAPSLQQINFSSTFTTVQGGEIAEVKIAPNYSPITQAAGIPELKQETSVNASVGFSWKPAMGLTVTVDGYLVRVKDRVVLSGQFSAEDPTLNPSLTSALQGLKVSLAQFFANAVNTTNKGLDIVVDYSRQMGKNRLHALLAGNFQDMNIDKINVPDLLDDTDEHRLTFLSDREQSFILASAPPVKLALNLEYGYDRFTIGTRLSYFGKITLLGYGEDGLGINPMVPTNADPNTYVPDAYVYGGKLVPDIYAGWKINEHLNLSAGIDNFLNIHPDLAYAPGASEWAFNNETGGPWDAVQMGGNGLRVFTRLAFTF